MSTTTTTRPKRLLNEHQGSKLTEELISSLVELYPDDLGRLDDEAYQAGVRVVVRRDYEVTVKEAKKVSVISGGGSGHEPAHAGFCGAGLLTAAVCGDVFASPSAKAILCAIVATSSPEAGCLLIVKNYTGDRLNFGLAAETARSEFGIAVETVYVCDDAALPAATQPRGLAGTVFVHKVAGALAERGAALPEVARKARAAAKAVATMGVAYEVCCLPDLSRRSSDRVQNATVELGLGIHGEPGATVRAAPTAAECAAILMDAVEAKLFASSNEERIQLGPRKKVALLVNNLGSTTNIELTVFAACCKRECATRGLSLRRLCVGTLMTSLDMHGVSATLADLGALEDFEALLDAPCQSPALTSGAWRKMMMGDDSSLTTPTLRVKVEPRAALTSGGDDGALLDESETHAGSIIFDDDDQVPALIEAACRAVIENEPALTEMDTLVGDGDCGTTLRQGAEAVLRDIEGRRADYARAGAARVCGALGARLADSMGGSSGILYNIGLKAAQAHLQKPGATWRTAFAAFAEAIAKCGGAGVGSRTMCDATLPAAQALLAAGTTLADAARAARRGADSTKQQLVATHGRSASVSADRLDGIPDPGAVAVALIFEALENHQQ